MKMFIFHASGHSLHGWLIRNLTGGEWNHSGIGFMRDRPDDPNPLADEPIPSDIFYFESYWKKTPPTNRDGIRGPVPWEDVLAWSRQDPGNRYIQQWLPLSSDQAVIGYHYCVSLVGKVAYAFTQLWFNAKRFLTGMGQASWQSTGPAKMTCSEFASRTWDLVDPGVPGKPGPCRKYLGIGDRWIFDDVPPSYRDIGLAEAVENYLAASTPPLRAGCAAPSQTSSS